MDNAEFWEALRVAERDLDAATKRRVEAQNDEMKLSRLVSSLRMVLGQPPKTLGVSTTASNVTGIQYDRETPLPVNAEPRTSTDRVIAILDELGKPMRPPQILTEFTRRGWTEENWKVPAAAVAEAARRAWQDGKVARNPQKEYVSLATAKANDQVYVGDQLTSTFKAGR